MIKALVELFQAGGDAYAEVKKAGRKAAKKLNTGGDENTPPVISALQSFDAAFDVLQEGADTAHDRFMTRARTTVTEAQARHDEDD